MLTVTLKVEPPLIDLEDGLTDEFLTSPDLQEETKASQPSQGVDKRSEVTLFLRKYQILINVYLNIY